EVFAKDPLAESTIPEGEIPVFELTREGADKILTAVGATLLDPPKTAPGEPLGLSAALTMSPAEARTVETANVLGILPGSDPYLRQEVIILGAHYDHVGDDPAGLVCEGSDCTETPGLRYPGANDNASGVGVLLEIARSWHEQGFRPKRSVLFAAWGAEELGQLGSRYFLENPTLPLDHSLGIVQLDGVGSGDGFYLGAQGVWEQDALLLGSIQNAAELQEEELVFSDSIVSSDQLPFREAGFPGILVQWRLANEANLPDGMAGGVDPGKLGATGRLVSLALMALAGGN
ncbi:MAG TPA: M20/M25/M40 family metallo-hydrolase, partial [Anaerolineales bacterium]|nr:M20/M25/M40 family metallo-hydrolase [Anaerolineales bacterium]